MKGTCWDCGTGNVDVNPYRDSSYCGLCLVCQTKRVKGKNKTMLALGLNFSGTQKND